MEAERQIPFAQGAALIFWGAAAVWALQAVCRRIDYDAVAEAERICDRAQTAFRSGLGRD